MKFLVTTCDKYVHLLPEFAARLNRYWPGLGVEVVAAERQLALPPNFSWHMMGPETPAWTTQLSRFLTESEIDSRERVVLMLDDYYVTRPVDRDQFETAVSITTGADKLDLTRDRSRFPHRKLMWPFIESDQSARYRWSLQAAVWRVGYLRPALKEPRTPWEFELAGNKFGLNDGAKIMGTECGIVQYDNVMLKGERNPKPC